MRFAFKIYPEKKLIIESFSGRLSHDFMFECFTKVWNHPDYKKTYRGMSDMQDAELRMSLAEFRTLEARMYEHPLKCQNRWTWIADRPLPTAYGILHEQNAKAEFPFAVYSNWKNGFEWVETPFEYSLVETVRTLRDTISESDAA